jgi:hypothetical protein
VLDSEGRQAAGVSVFLLGAAHYPQLSLEQIDPETCALFAEARTQSDGSVVLPRIKEDRVLVLAVRDRNEEARAWVGNSDALVLRLSGIEDLSFEAHVVAESLLPIARFDLELIRVHGATTSTISRHEVTSSNGRFRALVKGGIGVAERLSAVVRSEPEYLPTSREFGREELLSIDSHTIVMPAKRNGVPGFVFDSSGQPIEGAFVSWAEAQDRDDYHSTTTNARGAFLVNEPANLESGLLSVRADGYAPLLQTLSTSVPTAGGELIIELSVGSSVEGVVARAGIPVPGVRVLGWRGSDLPQGLGLGGDWFVDATTDADGRYKLVAIPAGTLMLGVDPRSRLENSGPPNLTGMQRVVVANPQHRLDFPLAPSIRIQGAIDVERVEGAVLYLQVIDGREPFVAASATESEDGRQFHVLASPSTELILRVWLNSTSTFDIPIRPSVEDLELGKLLVPLADFRNLALGR